MTLHLYCLHSLKRFRVCLKINLNAFSKLCCFRVQLFDKDGKCVIPAQEQISAKEGYFEFTKGDTKGFYFIKEKSTVSGVYNKFEIDAAGNISFVKNKLLSLIEGNDMYVVPSSGSNLLGGSMHALINGQPISTFYMLKMEGIYQRDDEVPAKLYAKGVRAGDVKYFDYNEDGDISDADRMNVGKAIPDFYGGITSNFSYKGFDLSLFGQFSVGGKVMSAWRGVNGSEGTDHLGLALSNVKVSDRGESVEQYFNVSKEVANGYWRGEGTSNTIPRPVRMGVHTGYDYDYNVQTSTRYLEDASYFKLKTVTLGYTLPESVVKKLRVNSLRAYVSADNLLTLTKYSGYDPETSFSGSPGDSNYGVDFGLQPVLRTFIFGLNLNF